MHGSLPTIQSRWGVPQSIFGSTNHTAGITISGIMLYMCPANGRRRYNVTSSLIGWAHTQNDPWTEMEVMSHTPVTVLSSPGQDCLTVYVSISSALPEDTIQREKAVYYFLEYWQLMWTKCDRAYLMSGIVKYHNILQVLLTILDIIIWSTDTYFKSFNSQRGHNNMSKIWSNPRLLMA